jgi:hypothetical protein
VNLLEAREKLAAALSPIAETDPTVLVSLVDAIEPPALMLGWADPWLRPETGCFALGRIQVIAVGARLMPGEGVAVLESLVDYTLTRVAVEPENWAYE